MLQIKKIEIMGMLKYRNCLSALSLLISIQLSAAVFEDSKQIKYAFQIDKTASVELNNQYGEIEVNAWEKDSILVIATIKVSSDNLAQANELFELVEVNCRGNRTNVVVNSEWTEVSNVWKRGAMDLKKRYGSEKNLVINYKVYMPVTCRLAIKNRFGDVFLPNYLGSLRVEIAHGDLRARNIKDARKIDVKYGKILIKDLDQGLIYLSYGDLIVDNAQKVSLESKSSNIEFFKVKELNLESKNDDIRSDEVYQIRGNLTYSQLRIKKLDYIADLNTSYGDVNIKQIYSKFYSIRLNGNNTDIDLEFTHLAPFQFSIETSGNKSINFMKEATIINESKDGNVTYIEGYVKDKEASPLVNIVSKNGYISFY